ncbi:MAG TPA: CHAD domain-containing protein [Candidatus Marinimicrobia bacterium]|jgi:CHAD domain-containing protein|nr:CHAD domain-containing protein [Candidatus Neomarinimicrobiota bacterium]MDP7716778.1 CHAD domain-containing protein [Candidatus Neomarinimicrobiota bacterium]HJL84855.1 CHAD domain-containing protein [Candidatus Neomarinimicrobiota bacterium]HJM10884.1 CHAD domain-containing protein [Candidatus Neomarinimicrobiota bacterium]HJM86460.1 CHAD domain-containing protein [Candidatus Neomarinimicrobiota bacterium]|tara:strand:- start:98 stop:958 length:861 start_codon:yes stop_codon:yes gene_type:complete
MQNGLEKHYSDQIWWFKTYFDYTMERQGVEDVHQLRVFIKRIRTVLSLTQIFSDEVFKKTPHYELFSSLFRKAGFLREIHVNQALLYEVGPGLLPLYRDYLSESKDSATADLLAEGANFNFSAFEVLNKPLLERMNTLSDGQVAKQSVAYLMGKFNKVGALLDLLNDNQKVHKMRIHLQNVRAALRLMHDLNPSVEIEKLQSDSELLTDLIGRWHDVAVFVGALNHYTTSSDRKNSVDQLKNVIDQFSGEKESTRVEIGNALKQYLVKDKKTPLQTWANSPVFYIN